MKNEKNVWNLKNLIICILNVSGNKPCATIGARFPARARRSARKCRDIAAALNRIRISFYIYLAYGFYVLRFHYIVN